MKLGFGFIQLSFILLCNVFWIDANMETGECCSEIGHQH